MKITQERPIDFSGFCNRYILPLGNRAVTSHFQLFPGIYASDQRTFAETEALGAPLPVTCMPADYLELVRQAKRFQSPFRRLRVLPGIGQTVGAITYDANDIEVMKNMSRRNLAAGEIVRITSYGEHEIQLADLGNRYADEYLRGAEHGVSRLSFWTVAEAKEGQENPELVVVRLMSYDATGKLAVRHCLPPLDEDLAAYVNFWQDVYTNAQPLESSHDL